ncbi:MAG: histidine kinase [Roseiflexus castenholzii]|uniref:sensor histidine kinase n=1 Tax=Roseiflexus castenholzii TaxID=120962 RepID=UPI000CABA368|nr:MAG: histidine kinase [Roseiflexus castenholzii]
MDTKRHPFPWQAYVLLIFAGAPLIAGTTSFISALNLLGQPSIGILPLWQGAIKCNAVSPITPPSWPGMASGALQTGDCIEMINDVSALTWPYRELERYTDSHNQSNLVDLIIRRGGEPLIVRAPVLRLTWLHVLQLQAGIIPIILVVWTLALVVLLAQPHTEANQVFAALFLVLALAIAGLFHGLNDAEGRYYTAFTIVSSMAWIGPLLHHLALLTPRPLPRFAFLRFALHPIGLAAMTLHLDSMLKFAPLLQSWRASAPGFASAINGVTMLIGLAAFLGRAGFWAWRGDRSIANRMWVLLMSWGLGAGPLTLASAYYLLTYRAPLWTSLQPFLFCLVILCTGTAYAMLRYQSFAYRGRVLNVLAMIYLSAAIACVVMVIVLIGIFRTPVDGLLFMALWSATFTTTLFWHTDSPFRRLYRRFFLRHQHHYQATLDFATRMNQASDLDAVVQQGATLIRQAVMSDWVAVRHALAPDRIWLATAMIIEIRQANPLHTDTTCLPEAPAVICQLASEGELLGTLYVGARHVPEPLDEEDERLIGLLATMLAHAMHIRAQIQRLSEVPALMIAAQEQERERIAQEIHDGVLPALGALPLGLIQIEQSVRTGAPADTIISICEAYRERAVRTTRELRSILRHLQPPIVGGTHLGLSIQAFTQEICNLYQVQATIHGATVVYPLDEFTSRHAYRIIQQAIVNALQHARPDRLDVSIEAGQHGWTCRVSDNGHGFDPQQSSQTNGFGIFSMRERARIIGATLTIESQPGQGTTVTLQVKGKKREGRKESGALNVEGGQSAPLRYSSEALRVENEGARIAS